MESATAMCSAFREKEEVFRGPNGGCRAIVLKSMETKLPAVIDKERRAVHTPAICNSDRGRCRTRRLGVLATLSAQEILMSRELAGKWLAIRKLAVNNTGISSEMVDKWLV